MTKNQHLIWRKYLAPWTEDITSTKGNIAYFNKITGKEKERKSICTIGCEKYTYDISTINEKDKEAILRYFNEWLNRFKSETKYVKAEFLKSDKILERDYIEHNFIGVIEQKGIKMLNDLYAGKFPFENPTISQQDWECRFDFFEFLSVQMLRTWRAREVIFDSIDQTIEKFNDTCFKGTTLAMFPLMMVVNSQVLASAFCKNNFYIELISNKTERNFITGDFPLINLCANFDKAEESLDEMELYYPITPRIAIICKNTIGSNITRATEDICEIDDFNKKIFKAAKKEVYAKNIEDLHIYFEK